MELIGPVALAVSLLAFLATALVIARALGGHRNGGARPCYRCGARAATQYMNLDYCEICRDVVVAMIGTVGRDPPFGFPGAAGYLEPVRKKND